MSELRLTDPDGYTVPGSIRTTTPDTDPQVREELKQLATDHATQWAEFGYHPGDYRVLPGIER